MGNLIETSRRQEVWQS